MNLGGAIHLNKSGICLVLTVFALIFFYFISKTADTSSVANAVLTNSIDLKKLLRVAIKAAQNGGDEILRAKDNLQIDSKGKTKEGIDDPVTTADYNSHCVMKATFMQYPDLLVVSEEAKSKCDFNDNYHHNEPKNINLDFVNNDASLFNISDLTVWIDPLDATKEFTEHLYQYVTTMVCIAVKGEPIIGVIHKPFQNKTYWAWVGTSEQNLQFRLRSESDKPRVVVSISHSGMIKESLEKSFKKNIDIVTAAGAGYKVLEVVAGNADAYLHSTAIKKWDICAGNAILNAIGGKMTSRDNEVITYFNDGNPVNKNGVIATLHNHENFVGNF